jgi:hypothetical protein
MLDGSMFPKAYAAARPCLTQQSKATQTHKHCLSQKSLNRK